MRQIIAAALIVASLLVVNTEAWWCTGHMVIAEIARQNLNPGVEAQVNERFSFLNKWFPQSNNMVAGACWADDLKSQSLEVMAGWHFINQVYNPENVPVTIKNWPMQKINVETAIADLDRTMQSTNVNDWISAYAVANLVHFIGDIHQPLHATDRFNPTFPDGDRGGNLIKVWWAQKEWPLHFIWDSVCGLYTEEPNRPLDQADQTYITNLANQYQANFSIPSDDKKTWNSTVMALESYEAAIKYSYANNTITNNQTLTQSYIDTCKTVAGYRIAAAGYRLAHELNYIFYRPPSAGAILNRIKEARDEFHRAVGGRAAERRSSP